MAKITERRILHLYTSSVDTANNEEGWIGSKQLHVQVHEMDGLAIPYER